MRRRERRAVEMLSQGEFGIQPQSGSLDASCKAMTLLQEFIEKHTSVCVFVRSKSYTAKSKKVFGKQVAGPRLGVTRTRR